MLDLCLQGHEADARVLPQHVAAAQLFSLVTEQQTAQQYISDNPPPPVPMHQSQQGQQEAEGRYLLALALQIGSGTLCGRSPYQHVPSGLVANTFRDESGAKSAHERLDHMRNYCRG